MPAAIYKYSLPVMDHVAISMPFGAKPLCVQVQRGLPRIWALVDPSQPLQERHFQVFGTGHDASAAGTYLGTVQLESGNLIFHVFEDVAGVTR